MVHASRILCTSAAAPVSCQERFESGGNWIEQGEHVAHGHDIRGMRPVRAVLAHAVVAPPDLVLIIEPSA